MTILSDYQKYKAQQTLDRQNKELEMKRNQYNRLEERTKNIPSIIDMRSAYEQVIKSNHIPSESEKRFRQFTSSELNIKS
tara:strand:- start:218 stop:457 length:240 start_codon:yes stop_codon:yes gene_type:complete